MVVSDTGRAKETARILNAHLKLPFSFDSRLRELDWGRWTGKTIAQVKTEASDDLAELESAGWNFCPPGGEDRLTLLKRSQAALSEAAQKWPGMCILIVSHEGVIKGLIYHLCGRKFLPSEPAIIKPYHLHRIIFDPNGLQLEKTNALALD
jgi:probable phosphoglycerate mutase